MVKIQILPLNFLKIGVFSPKFGIFGRQFFDTTISQQFSDSSEFRGKMAAVPSRKCLDYFATAKHSSGRKAVLSLSCTTPLIKHYTFGSIASTMVLI